MKVLSRTMGLTLILALFSSMSFAVTLDETVAKVKKGTITRTNVEMFCKANATKIGTPNLACTLAIWGYANAFLTAQNACDPGQPGGINWLACSSAQLALVMALINMNNQCNPEPQPEDPPESRNRVRNPRLDKETDKNAE